ncbi:MAG TPA: tRNA pseudouridine(55) synthase TruB [Candidatus Saccharimonadales bacterium]|nr:tRNA pseudouridine(55) synthase TruB [Candidatus Saccharimonadales bacterium]
MDGILLVDKGPGLTSHQVVEKVRRTARCRHAGHAGSLDPMATGLLLVAVGEGTKLTEILMGAGKVYQAVVRLGTATETEDAEGAVTQTAPVPPLTPERVEAALAAFRGEFEQVPPRYSALKVDGVRAYERARGGESFDLKSRRVTVHEMELLECAPPDLTLRVRCGRGTYIRSLARDLGCALGTVAHLAALRRTRVGPYRVEDALAVTAEQPAQREALRAALVPLRRAFGDAPTVRVREEYLGDLRFGRSPRPDQLLDPVPQGEGVRFLLVDGSREPLAVAEPDPVTGGGRLRRVLQRAATRLSPA